MSILTQKRIECDISTKTALYCCDPGNQPHSGRRASFEIIEALRKRRTGALQGLDPGWHSVYYPPPPGEGGGPLGGGLVRASNTTPVLSCCASSDKPEELSAFTAIPQNWPNGQRSGNYSLNKHPPALFYGQALISRCGYSGGCCPITEKQTDHVES